jgi:hypothetical protein
MRDVEKGADRPAHAVHETYARIGERHSCGRRSKHHRLARRPIVRRGAGDADVPRDQSDRTLGEAVGIGIGPAADLPLKPMR